MSSNSSTMHPLQPSQSNHPYSMIEIDGSLYYLTSLHTDECVMNYSHTMSTALLESFTNYARCLSDQTITTIVFENIPTTEQTQEKKVVGFWNPQLSKFVINI